MSVHDVTHVPVTEGEQARCCLLACMHAACAELHGEGAVGACRLKRAGLDYWEWVTCQVNFPATLPAKWVLLVYLKPCVVGPLPPGLPGPACHAQVQQRGHPLPGSRRSSLSGPAATGRCPCQVHDDWESFYEFFKKQDRGRLIAFSKFSDASYTAPGTYHPGDWLLFGAETTGLPPEVKPLLVVEHESPVTAVVILSRCPLVDALSSEARRDDMQRRVGSPLGLRRTPLQRPW